MSVELWQSTVSRQSTQKWVDTDRAFVEEPMQIRSRIVRITVFCSAIVIDVIVHCHTAGPFESKCTKQLSLSSCGWVLIRSGQFKITLVAELEIQPLIRSFWTETSAITFSTFSIAVTVFLRPPTVATGA